MKVLITGGAGYIGSVLTPLLLSESHQVTVLDNFMYDQNSLLDVVAHKKLRLLRADVRDQRLLKEELQKHDVIIPLAGLIGAPLCDREPALSQEVNCDVIKRLYDQKSKDQMLIYPCTNSGYGIGEKDIFCNEKTALRPISLYGKQKVEAETYILEKGEGVTFRFATLFGASPKMRLDLLVNDFTYRAYTDRYLVLFESHFKRNYLHVRDAARAFLHVINHYEQMKGEAFNVGLSSANLDKSELCAIIKKFIPEFVFLQSEVGTDPDKRNYIVSNEKIEKTGFQTEHTLEDGIEELIKCFTIIKKKNFSNI